MAITATYLDSLCDTDKGRSRLFRLRKYPRCVEEARAALLPEVNPIAEAFNASKYTRSFPEQLLNTRKNIEEGKRTQDVKHRTAESDPPIFRKLGLEAVAWRLKAKTVSVFLTTQEVENITLQRTDINVDSG